MSASEETEPAGPYWSRWGMVTGIVRTASGEPVVDCNVAPRPITNPAEGLPEMAHYTNAEGRYHFGLPLATYTMLARCQTASGTSLYGEVPDVVITAGHTVVVDITVTERPWPSST